MDHRAAIELHAAERYLLGELADGERDAFEEHYFDCPECARDVRSGAILIDNIKATPRPLSPPVMNAAPRPSGWRTWLQWPVLAPTFAALAFAIFSGILWQRGVEPQSVPVAILATTRAGAIRSIPLYPDDQFLQLSMDVNDQRPFERYQCVLQKESGEKLATFDARLRDGRLNLLIPAKFFPFVPAPDRYTLIARGIESGQATGEPQAYWFQIERKH
jgi:hypothetical protein